MRRLCCVMSSLAALLWLYGCTSNAPHTIFPAGVRLKAGDVVFRRGGGFTSHVVLYADKGGNYSHVGIVVDSAGIPMIAHAVPGEPDYDGDQDRVKLETIDAFYMSYKADNGCVMRCDDSVAASEAARVAMGIYRQNTLFDHEYNDADTTAMYCCELVEYAYSKAGVTLATTPRHDINLPGMKFNHVILPSDISTSDALREVIRF